jgi:hypothetical protein
MGGPSAASFRVNVLVNLLCQRARRVLEGVPQLPAVMMRIRRRSDDWAEFLAVILDRCLQYSGFAVAVTFLTNSRAHLRVCG